MGIRYQEIKAESVINKLKHVDDWFWVRYTVNPYRGCFHACEYCDARSHKYQTHSDFDQTILVKTNAKEIAAKEVKSVRPDGVGIDGATDAYQPAEAKFRISRKLLEVFKECNFPCFFNTKSDLILRDLDIIQDIDKGAWSIVTFTVTTFNENLRLIFEPKAPSAQKRLKALQKFASSGIKTGIMFCPIIPYILDNNQNLEEVVRRAKQAGAQFILFGAMTMKDRQRERMISLLKYKFPQVLPRYQKIYGKSASPSTHYWHPIQKKLEALCHKYDIPDRIKRPIPCWEKYPVNKKVAEHLLVEAYRKQVLGEDSYKIWAYRKAGWTIDELDCDIAQIYKREGAKGLQKLPSVGESMSKKIQQIIAQMSA